MQRIGSALKYWFVNLSYSVFMKIIPIFVLFILSGCSPKIIYLPSETTVEYRDSIITKIDTIPVPLPVEVIQTIVPAVEVWEAETSLAEARCELDTNLMVLRGELKNKQKNLPVVVPSTEQYHSRDSVRIEYYPQEVPVPQKYIPWWVKTLAWIGGIVSLAALAWLIGKLIIK